MNCQQMERLIEARQRRRETRDYNAHLRFERRYEAADAMVGELASGKCYVYPAGGQYREGERHDLIMFLIRNRYV